MSKDKPAQKSIPEFKFNSNDEKLALTANDMDIYPQLGIFNQAMWSNQEHYPHKLYHNDVRFTRSHEQPDMLPVTINGLGEFHDGINDINGFWSVFWFSDRLSSNDFVYGDEFRRVVVFGSMELAIRPVQYDGEIPRIFLPRGDAQDCLNAAMDAVLAAKPEEPIAAVTGRASTMNPKDELEHLDPEARPKFTFEWKVAHMPVDTLAPRVQKWRCKVCKGSHKLETRERQYLRFLQTSGCEDPRKDRKYKPPRDQRKKRPSGEMGASQELGPSSKRPSTDSQPESESQSSLSSPAISRSPSVATSSQRAMRPPPPVGPRQTGVNIQRTTRQLRGRRGSRGSTGSATSRLGSRLADLALQSPSEGSPEGVAPPPDGLPWGSPQDVATRDPAHFGAVYEPQAGPHGYQGPGRVQQAPAPGEFTEVYGHAQRVEPSRPRRPPQVGIQHTQFTEEGHWVPPQPGQQQLSADQGPAQRSHQHAGFEGAQYGSGYPYPPPSPSSEGEDHPSILEDMYLTESPQLEDLTEPQLEEGNILSGLQDIPRLPPPAMSNKVPALLQTRTALPPVGQSYPSTLSPPTESVFAELIDWSEDEDAPVDLESEWHEEDDQFSHQDPSVTPPLLYHGDRNDDRTYYPAPAMREGQPAHVDPYMGANQFGEGQSAFQNQYVGATRSGEEQPVYEEPYLSASESSEEEP